MRAFRWSPATDAERLKYEVADELGLLEKLLKVGWGGLTAEETGKIGGIVARRLSSPRSGKSR